MRRLVQDERGATAILTAITGAVLAGVAAISVDLGVLYFEARKCQTAADLAALAGARDIGRAEDAARATASGTISRSRLRSRNGCSIAEPTGSRGSTVRVVEQAPSISRARIRGAGDLGRRKGWCATLPNVPMRSRRAVIGIKALPGASLILRP